MTYSFRPSVTWASAGSSAVNPRIPDSSSRLTTGTPTAGHTGYSNMGSTDVPAFSGVALAACAAGKYPSNIGLPAGVP